MCANTAKDVDSEEYIINRWTESCPLCCEGNPAGMIEWTEESPVEQQQCLVACAGCAPLSQRSGSA